jgi:hypothetical protein
MHLHIGQPTVEGSTLRVPASPSQEEVTLDLLAHEVPLLDAWPWFTNALLLLVLGLVLAGGAAWLGTWWGWIAVGLLDLALLRGVVSNLRATPVVRLKTGDELVEVRLSTTPDDDLKELCGRLSLVRGAIGFAPGLAESPVPNPSGGLCYLLTHEKLSQSLHLLDACYREGVGRVRMGELSCEVIHLVLNETLPWSAEGRDAVTAALATLEAWSETTGPRVRATFEWLGAPAQSARA